jgi:hypothetical protein
MQTVEQGIAALAAALASMGEPSTETRSTAKHHEARLYNTRRAAKYLSMNYNDMLELFREGAVPAFKSGNAWRTTQENLEVWIAEQFKAAELERLPVTPFELGRS